MGVWFVPEKFYRVVVQSVRMLVLGTSGWGFEFPSPYLYKKTEGLVAQ